MNMTLDRRALLKKMFWGSSALAVGGVSQLAMIRQALAAQKTSFQDYKALVCVMFLGGNDSLNMLVPRGVSGAYKYDDYLFAREGLAVADTSMNLADVYSDHTLMQNPYEANSDEAAYLKGTISLSNHHLPLGVNSLMPELAKLLDENQATIIANSGNLIKPLNKEMYLANQSDHPPFLFAHNHQQRAMFTGWGDNLKAKGWAGRLADTWLNQGVNSGSALGLNISYAGSSRLLEGNQTMPMILPTNTIPQHTGLTAGNARRAVFEQLLNDFQGDDFSQLYQQQMTSSVTNFEAIRTLWNETEDPFTGVLDSYGQALFSIPSVAEHGLSLGIDDDLIERLSAVAKMIHLGSQTQTLGTQRQIFYVTMGGFDTHASQTDKHPAKLRGISLALDKFKRAMDHLGLSDQVALFTMSDFGRTLRTNGDGTDHAWGSHSLVMGGGSQGGLIGQLPDLTLGGEDDVTQKGRILPTIAQDQVNATLASWFGVEDELVKALFPNIEQFQTSNNLDSAFINWS